MGVPGGSTSESSCSHVRHAIGDVRRFVGNQDIGELQCTACGLSRNALWLCLYPHCETVGCGKSAKDHSTSHFSSDEAHCVHLSLSTWRVWCHACDCEVYPESNDPPFPAALPPRPAAPSVSKKARRGSNADASSSAASSSTTASWDSGLGSQRSLKIPLWPVGAQVERKDYLSYEFFETEDWTDDEGDAEDGSPLLFPQITQPRKRPQRRGLVGFANLGNTCYLNAALQTLCHVQPLVDFFLHCEETLAMAAAERAGDAQVLPPVRPTRSNTGSFPDYSLHSPFGGGGGGGDDRLSSMEPRLAAAFTRLLQIIYDNPPMPHVAPSAVLLGIRMVNPTFRGYHQQDSQEFMRCFMDQLHEETKYLVIRDARDLAGFPGAADRVQAGSGEGGDRVSDEEAFEDVRDKSGAHSDDDEEDRDRDASGDNRARDVGHIGHIEVDVEMEDERGYETCDSGLSNSTSSEDSAVEADRLRVAPVASTVGSSGPASAAAAAKRKHRHQSLHLPSMSGNHDDSGGGGGGGRSRSSDGVLFSLGQDGGGSGRERSGQQVGRSRTRSKTSRRSGNDGDSCVGPGVSKSFKSIISAVFDGKLMSSVQCLTCGQVSSTLETFQDLSLPIPSGESLQRLRSAGPSKSTAAAAAASLSSCSQDLPAAGSGWLAWLWNYLKSWLWGPTVSLHDCLAAFFSADELKGDNMYSCGTCKKLRNGMKLSRVLELPEVMCIHLKRFRHEYLGSSKISTRVSFPLECIDMGPYLHKDCKSEVTTYNLVGVICHLGNTLGGGHYVSYCVSPGKKWYEFDDRVVSKTSADVVANVEAYVLLYQKYDALSWFKRERIIQLLNQSMRGMDLMRFYVSKEWLVKFNTCAEPGPIDNSNFLCPHGAVWPHRVERVNDLCVEVPQSVWEELQRNYGGGLACNRLQLCRICEEWQDRIHKRQAMELEKYQELYDEFRETETSVYAVSLSWFRQWQAFVRGRMFDIPGPIDNKHVSKTVSGRQSASLRGPYKNDYVQVSEDMWNWFRGVYGGGPAVLLREVVRKPVVNADDVDMDSS